MPLQASSTEDQTHRVSEDQDQSQRQQQQLLQLQPEQIPGGGDRTGAVQPTLRYPGPTLRPAETGPSPADEHWQDTQSADGQAQCGLGQTLKPAVHTTPKAGGHVGHPEVYGCFPGASSPLAGDCSEPPICPREERSQPEQSCGDNESPLEEPSSSQPGDCTLSEETA